MVIINCIVYMNIPKFSSFILSKVIDCDSLLLIFSNDKFTMSFLFSNLIKFEFIGIKCLEFFAKDSEIICCTHNNLGSLSFDEIKFIISILQSSIFDK